MRNGSTKQKLPSNTLRAGTHGRSVWDLNISTLLPVVDITSISPSSAGHDGAGFTLTVNGGNFDSTSVVGWNNSALTTTLVSVSKVTAAVPATEIANAGKAKVTVFNSSTNIVSHAVTFTIN